MTERNCKDVGSRLQLARKSNEFTRVEFSKITGIPASTIEKYERGDMDPNTTRLKIMCRCLQVPILRILG